MVIMDETQDYHSESDSNDSETSTEDTSLKRKNKKQGGTSKRNKIDDDVLPKASKSNKNKNDLYKQPTAEELNQLRETQNLFNSNIFRLQIDELLAEVKVKPKYLTEFNSWFKNFENHLTTIQDLGEIKLDEKKKSKKLQKLEKLMGNGNPLFSSVENITMKFEKPTSTFCFGEFKSLTGSDIKYNPNIGVVMPKSCFYEKDFLNNKYCTKKFYYIFYLMQHLKKSDVIKDITLDYYLGNFWQPILVITPNVSDKVKVNLFILPENDTFKCSRFLPNKNNIKQNVFKNTFNNFNVEKFSEKGTFLYNSILLQDITLESNQKHMAETLKDLNNVLDGIKLLIVWLKQRNLNTTFTGFTTDLLMFTIQYLALKRKITKHMSSYQVVRIFWTFLTSLNDEVLSICEDNKADDLEVFKNSSSFVLLDVSGCYNVAAFLDGEIFSKTKQEAELALKVLDYCRFDSFATLFVTQVPITVQYDAILKIKCDKGFKSMYKGSSVEEKFRYFGFYDALIYNQLLKNLKMGLNQRAKQIIPIYPNNASSGLNAVTFGINLDPEFCSNVIEKGPKQFEAGAEDFKKFWGSLAELRRFKDSSIYEAVYFEHAKTIQDKRLIYKYIIDFVMKTKLNLSYELYGHEMETLIKLDRIQAAFPIGSNEEATLKIKSILYNLSKIMRELKLPLAITAIQGNSDSYSYTDIFPPIPTLYKTVSDKFNNDEVNLYFKTEKKMTLISHYVSPIQCVIQLALHSKWPKDLGALRAMKQVFNFEINKLLKLESIKSSVGEDYIDVFYEGLVFRMRLYHPKEVALLKKDVSVDGETSYKDTEESLRMERQLDILPKIHGALNGIQQEHPSFGPSTCLIKRWLRSQMLDDYHIPDVVINLLNAALFLSPEPFTPSTLPQVAFLRFLKFMAEYDFNFHPVVVNFNSDLSSDELNEIETKFLQNRQNYSSVCIITPYDDGLSVYTKNSPTENILRRISCLAGETYKYLSNSIDKGNTFRFKACFIPNLEGYALLIHIKPKLNPRRYQQIVYENENPIKLDTYDPKIDSKIPIVDFNPVDLYLKELRENYGDYALFFHDFYGGNVIGVLWKEKALEKVDFKISTVGARKCLSDQLSLNTDALIEDFYTLGSGVVDTIVVQNK